MSNVINQEVLGVKDAQKIKILKMYDFIIEKEEELKEKGYPVLPLLRAFQISHYEISGYLKNVCNLSQKLETANVCETLQGIKDRLEKEAKTKKASVNDITSRELINDKRFSLINLDDDIIEIEAKESFEEESEEDVSKYFVKPEPIKEEFVKPEPIKYKEEELFNEDITKTSFASTDVDNKLYNEDNSANVITPKKIIEADEEFNRFSGVNFNHTIVGDENIDVVDDELELKRNIAKELATKDIEYEEEVQTMNLSKTKAPKKANKFVVIIGGTVFMSVCLAGTFLMLFSEPDSAVSTSTPNLFMEATQQPSNANTNANQLEILAKNNSIVAPITINEPVKEVAQDINKDESLILEPTAPINPIVSNEDILYPTENINKPIVNKVETGEAERLAKIEAQLSSLIQAMSNGNMANPSPVANTPTVPVETNTAPVSPKATENIGADFKNIASVTSAMKKLKFNKTGFEYAGKTYKEGDVIGNIKIDTFIPNGYIEFRELDTNNAKAIKIN